MWFNEILKGIAKYIISSFFGEAILKSIGPIEMPVISNHLLQLIVISTTIFVFIYAVKFRVDRYRREKEEEERQEIERKRMSLISAIKTLLRFHFGEETYPGQEAYFRLVKQGLQELDLFPQEPLGVWFFTYVEDLLEQLSLGIKEARDFAKIWRPH